MITSYVSLKENDKTIYLHKSWASHLRKFVEVLVNNLTVRYGLGHGFDVRVAIPYVSKNMSLTVPNANETTVGGIKVRIDDLTNTVYITTDGTNP